MEQAERADADIATEGATRSQNVVHTLPHRTDALATVIAPALERIDVTDPAVQLLIVTADAETAVIVSELVYGLSGPQGIEVVPVTSANRAARLMETRPVHAVAGPPLELQTLVQRSTLKLSGIRTVVLAWIGDALTASPDALASLEALFAELPKEAARIFTARQITPEVEQLIERYGRNARRMTGPAAVPDATKGGTEVPLQYVTAAANTRSATLRRLLDDLDPPSAAIIVRSADSREEAARTVRQLGYRRADDPVRVTDGTIEPGTHTVILYDAPATAAELGGTTGSGAVNVVALVTPRDADTLRAVAPSAVPFTLRGPGVAARQRDRVLRDELLQVLESGVASRELLALEPLLEQYDGVEIAAAAVRLLDRARSGGRQAAPAAAPAIPAARPLERQGDRPPRREGADRGPRDFGDRPRDRDTKSRGPRDFKGPPKRDVGDRPRGDFKDRPRDFKERAPRDFGGDRGRRDFGDRDRGPRDAGGDRDRGSHRGPDRGPRDFGSRPPRGEFNDRRKRNFGRGPRER